MNWIEYLKESKRTLSHEFHIEVANPMEALRALVGFEQLAKEIDNYKKGLFYGRAPKPITAPKHEPTGHSDHDELHALLGMVTELAELSEVVRESWDNPSEALELKAADEGGDFLWYFAILCRSRGWDFEKLCAGNIAKLRARFPEKFSSDLATNRNLVSEDLALAKGLK